MPTFTKKQIGIFIGVILVITSCIFYYKIHPATNKNVTIIKSEQKEEIVLDEENMNNNIKVYITGEVNSPGVYELPLNSRVVDVIEKADGFTEEADRVSINLAKILKDEEQIVVLNILNQVSNEVSNNRIDVDISSGTVNINKATKEQLMTLPNVGSVTAENIISYREAYGLFKSIEEIKNVTRIGEKTFESLKELISVD